MSGSARLRVSVGFLVAVVALAGEGPARGTAPGAFERVGDMGHARISPKATLLSDGTVLVTGGFVMTDDQAVTLDSAELFDPRADTFRDAGPMTQPRDTHQITRLPDGRVLITGGLDGDSVQSSAEIYDPAEGKFAPTSDMMSGRVWHTSTLMSGGKVLLAGGIGVYAGELFDPVTERFQETGEMVQPRWGHAAIALRDGRVVVLGGIYDDTDTTPIVEIYDPRTGTFTDGGELVEGRWLPTAVLLPDDRILVAGGAQPAQDGDVPLSSVEIYDPATRTSTTVGPLTVPRRAQVGALLTNGRTLVAGGIGKDGERLRSAELIDPVAGTSSPTGPLATVRSGAAGVVLQDGRALVLGGWDGQRPLASAEVYAP